MSAAVVLAAGASTRLGTPKQLIRFEGERLLERAVRTAREAGCTPVLVVLGCGADRVRSTCVLGDALIVENEAWQEGMASSIRAGIAGLEADGAVILTCDMPAVTPAHLQKLIASGTVTASRYAGRNGVPAFFPAACFPQLLDLRGDEGARTILRAAAAIDLPGGEVDIDTPEDVAALRGPAAS